MSNVRASRFVLVLCVCGAKSLLCDVLMMMLFAKDLSRS